MPWPYDGSNSIAERERSRAYQALAQLPELLNEHPAKERERRRYEIARDVMANWNETTHRFLAPAPYDQRDMARCAVKCADALLAALEADK